MPQTPLESRVAVNETSIRRLESTVYGNGQPGIEAKVASMVGVLEGKLTGHIERVERHTKNNMEQGDGELAHELEEERRQRERMHEETKTAREKDKAEQTAETKALSGKVDGLKDRLTYLVGGGTGILLALKIMEYIGLLHPGMVK